MITGAHVNKINMFVPYMLTKGILAGVGLEAVLEATDKPPLYLLPRFSDPFIDSLYVQVLYIDLLPLSFINGVLKDH